MAGKMWMSLRVLIFRQCLLFYFFIQRFKHLRRNASRAKRVETLLPIFSASIRPTPYALRFGRSVGRHFILFRESNYILYWIRTVVAFQSNCHSNETKYVCWHAQWNPTKFGNVFMWAECSGSHISSLWLFCIASWQWCETNAYQVIEYNSIHWVSSWDTHTAQSSPESFTNAEFYWNRYIDNKCSHGAHNKRAPLPITFNRTPNILCCYRSRSITFFHLITAQD